MRRERGSATYRHNEDGTVVGLGGFMAWESYKADIQIAFLDANELIEAGVIRMQLEGGFWGERTADTTLYKRLREIDRF